MLPNESLAISWLGSLATIVMFEDSLAVISGLGTIIFTTTMIIKNVQEIRRQSKK
jgi:hypothetical protein